MTKTALRQVLAAWLNERQRNLSPENSVHIHVDEVMKRLGRSHYHPVLDLVEPYEAVIDLLGDLVNDVIASLLIPLSIRVPRNDVFFYYQIDGVRGVPGYDDDRPFLRSILGRQYPETLRPRTS